MNKNFFSDAITLDPSATRAAWQKLASSTWPHEVAGLPAILHTTLRRRLKEEEKWLTTKPTARTKAAK